MPHYPKPFFRSARNAWFVQIGPKQIKLGLDKDAAFKQYHELMANTPEPAPPGQAELVAVVVDAFLDYVEKHLAADTYRWYKDRLELFCNAIPATLTLDQLKPFHVQKRVDSTPTFLMGRSGTIAARSCGR